MRLAQIRLLFMIFTFGILLNPIYGFAELNDPTRPSGYMSKQEFSNIWVLSSILMSPERKLAVINGQPLKIGDEMNGMKVKSIQVNSVQLVGPQGKITLFLLDKSILKRTME